MNLRLKDAVLENCVSSFHPDGTAYRSIPNRRVKALAKTHNATHREVEIAALEACVVPERYARNLKTYSLKAQTVLRRSHACVVGLGGLGGAVIEILSRLGVGELTLVDGDTFEESNLNRQFLCRETNTGKTKAQEAAARVSAINSAVDVKIYDFFLTEENGPSTLGHADVVVDCLGGLKNRFTLEKAAKTVNAPLVSSAVAGLAGHVTTIFPDDSGLKLIYGDPAHLPVLGAESSLGCLPQITTLFAALASSEVARIVLGKEPQFRNRLMAVDLEDMTPHTLQLRSFNGSTFPL